MLAAGGRSGTAREAAFPAAMPSASSRGHWRPGNEAGALGSILHAPPFPSLPPRPNTETRFCSSSVSLSVVSRVHVSARVRASHCGAPRWRRQAGGSAAAASGPTGAVGPCGGPATHQQRQTWCGLPSSEFGGDRFLSDEWPVSPGFADRRWLGGGLVSGRRRQRQAPRSDSVCLSCRTGLNESSLCARGFIEL